jgi:hypothetical protein
VVVYCACSRVISGPYDGRIDSGVGIDRIRSSLLGV